MALTDPAKELAVTLELIVAGETNMAVDQKISRETHVKAWSAEFFQIIFEIVNRCDLVSGEIEKLPLDEDVKKQALDTVTVMKGVFTKKELLTQTTNNLKPSLSASNTTILKMLSSQVRENISYHALSKEEKEEMLRDVSELIGWLEKLQSEEADFIRAALLEGLGKFKFRLERLDWFGWGYSVSSLKQVLEAYLALQGVVGLEESGDELIQAVMMKTKAFVERVLKTVEMAKTATESAGWALQTYGAICAISDGREAISGLLGH